MVAHERTDAKAGMQATPGFLPAFRENVGDDVHVIARLKKTKLTRELQVNPTGTIEAKTRLKIPEDRIALGDFNKLVVKWLNTNNEEIGIEIE